MSHFPVMLDRNVLYFILGLVIGLTFDVKFIIGGVISYIIYRYLIQQPITPQPPQPSPIWELVKSILTR